jgi:phosphatidylserine decarboxylase
MSRAWGKLNSIDLPLWFRKPTFYFYSWIFSCNLDEIEIEDLNEYKNLSEFFRRSLKPDARTIDIHSGLISPCDGKVLNFGQVNNGFLEQVKGVNYSLQGFLGNHNWPKNASSLSPSATASFAANFLGVRSTLLYKNLKSDTMSDIQSLQDHYENENMIYEKSILYNPAANRLYHCVIYLAPGDYHRFHSPTDWVIFFRRHFPGELFSVNPSVARWLQGLFNLNERVVYYGQWKYGFFSMAAVGATNVGSIKVFMDDNLTTNNKLNEKNLKNIKKEQKQPQQNQHFDRSFITDEDNEEQSGGVQMNRGEIFGEFNLGSTIVLIFEAPANFKFNIELNEKVRFGQPLGS